MPKPADDLAVTVSVLNHLHIPLAVPPLLPTSLDRSARCLELAERLGDPVLLRAAASGRRYSAGCSGDVAEMDRCFEISRPLVKRLDQPFMTWVETLQRGTRALIAGDADSAERLANEAFQIGSESGQPDAFIIFGAQMLMVSWWRGTIGEMVPLIEGAIADYPGLPFFTGVLAMAHAEGDRPAEAREILDRFGLDGYQLPMNVTWLTGMMAYGEAAAQAWTPRPHGSSSSSSGRLRINGTTRTSQPPGRWRGRLGTWPPCSDDSTRPTRALRATAVSERAGAAYYAARTALSWGRMLLERGRPDETGRAAELLGRARTLAEQHGYANVARRARLALGGASYP